MKSDKPQFEEEIKIEIPALYHKNDPDYRPPKELERDPISEYEEL